MNKEKMKSAYIKHIESMNEGELVELALGKGIFMDCDANDYSFYMSVLGSKDKHSNYHDGACICVGTATDTCGISDWPVTEAMEERYYDGDTESPRFHRRRFCLSHHAAF